MYISKVSIVNYRNFLSTKLVFSKGINTIIGENGSGKTNLFRAIRLLLDSSMRRSALQLEEKDFCRGLGSWKGHWIIISLEFSDVSQDEEIQSLFLHGVGNIEEEAVDRATYNLIFRPKAIFRTALSELNEGDDIGRDSLLSSLSIDDYETVITGKSSADFNDPLVYKKLVGDFERVQFPSDLNPPEIGGRVPPILSMAGEVSFTFVQALRDVVSSFHNNRTNPLFNLLKRKSGEINQLEFDVVAEQVKTLNNSIESLSDVTEVRRDIRATISDAVGDAYSPSSLSIKSDLSDEAEQLFQSLKLFIGEADDGYEGAIHEMSLGGANLIYLTLKLLEFQYQKANQSIANFLLIEEPEAHIHTHIQKSLFDKIGYSNTQIIYSTHSSHISEVSNVSNVNVLGMIDGKCEAFQPAYGLDPEQVRAIQRYLDAIRSNLLFAKSVVLVEGDAEEILIPYLIKQVLGVSLDELGISLVNIRSTGFENVALLFHNDRIRKRCSIITDLDKAFFDTVDAPGDPESVLNAKKKARNSQDSGLNRQSALNTFCNGNVWINPYYATHTFEVDFASVGNCSKLVSVLKDVYTDTNTIEKSRTELLSDEIAEYGKRALTMATNSGKGWFAILLSKVIDYQTVIPGYIVDAILFAHGELSKHVVLNILEYRINKIIEDIEIWQGKIDACAGSTNVETLAWVTNIEAYISARKTAVDSFKPQLESFREGSISFDQIKATMELLFPEDQINQILSRA